VLFECFDNIPTTWPWIEPAGGQARWRVSPGNPYPHWAIQTDFYSTNMCLDRQSVWCFGYPPANDPEYDPYPANYDTYMTYGPINLSTATAARSIFELLNRSEVAHDSVYWGAATSFTLTNANMNISGSFSGDSPNTEFQYVIIDLSDLWNYQTHDSVSMLGQSTVYLFWRFKSDGNANAMPRIGAFVDNVVIAWDDGGMDIVANSITYCRKDSVEYDRPLARDDTVRAAFHWYTCSGGVDDYPPFHVVGTYDDVVLLDTILTGVGPDSSIILYTDTFMVNASGHHEVRFVCDSLNEVAETHEDNNARTDTFYIAPPNTPPTFVWVTPATDTLVANTGAMLRYEAYDPDEDAILDFYYDNDQSGCLGPEISGGTNLLEHDGTDSLYWNTASIPEGRISYPFVQITDAGGITCVYAPFPVRVTHVSAVDPQDNGLPTEYGLAQNFPNPFNPETVIPYALPVRSEISLRVFDVLGHEVAVLASGLQEAGYHSAVWNAKNFSSGVYFCRLEATNGTQAFHATNKLMVLK
jgi:hypothetical protein